MNVNAGIRLDKYLADMRIGSRSQVKSFIKKGMITVNDTVVCKTDIKINLNNDTVKYKGSLVAYHEHVYYMLNKPKGVITATEDKHDKTVLDLIENKERKDIFPVGRLDKDTTGLLLITNDGELSHKLLSPKKHVPKVYEALIEGIVSKQDVKLFEEGITIGDWKTLPAKLDILDNNIPDRPGYSHIVVKIYEGKYHQVKRMFEAVDKKVIELKRIQMGSLCLDEKLQPGEYRKLTMQEISILQKEG